MLIGWTHGSTAFSNMVTSDTTRAQFVQNAVNYLKLHKFDGLGVLTLLQMMKYFQ